MLKSCLALTSAKPVFKCLKFNTLQVSVMQIELTDLQPELIETSKETDKIMVKIEHDSVEVEAKKEVRYVCMQKLV